MTFKFGLAPNFCNTDKRLMSKLACQTNDERRVCHPRPKTQKTPRILGISMEAAGIEPSADVAATENSVCDCENCQQCRAARALHFECFKSHFLASLDADLQRVVYAWALAEPPLRQMILAIVNTCR
jgi:hypothetical protein